MGAPGRQATALSLSAALETRAILAGVKTLSRSTTVARVAPPSMPASPLEPTLVTGHTTSSKQ